MKIVLKLLFILMLAGFPMAELFAQQGILSANCNASGNGGTVSWSVGLVAYSAWSESTGIITEGVQQPYEIFNIAGLEDFESDPEFIVFPNPTNGKVTLKFFDHTLKNLSSCIYDIGGTLLRRVEVDTEEVSIPMDDLKSATYFLVILEKDQPVKTYKIIKK
jgi:Secretion system C-terminal sorting domain